KDAERLFWLGCKHYWQGDHDEALVHVEAATELFADDARFWYYRALSESALGLERRGRAVVWAAGGGAPGPGAGGAAAPAGPAGVQGERRMWLREALEVARAAR